MQNVEAIKYVRNDLSRQKIKYIPLYVQLLTFTIHMFLFEYFKKWNHTQSSQSIHLWFKVCDYATINFFERLVKRLQSILGFPFSLEFQAYRVVKQEHNTVTCRFYLPEIL